MEEQGQNPPKFNLAELPWWGQLIYVVGVPSTLVIFLTWFITGGIDSKINAIVNNQMALQEAVKLHNIDTGYEIKEITTMKLVLQQICVNSAITSGQKTYECFKQ